MMKTLFDKRRELLRQVAADRGGATNLAKALGLTESAVSHMIGKTPTRNISERTARGIEEKLGLIEGTLDGTPDEPPGLDDDTLAAALQAVTLCATELSVRPTPQQQAKLVALVYSQALATGMPDAAYIKRLMKLIKP